MPFYLSSSLNGFLKTSFRYETSSIHGCPYLISLSYKSRMKPNPFFSSLTGLSLFHKYLSIWPDIFMPSHLSWHLGRFHKNLLPIWNFEYSWISSPIPDNWSLFRTSQESNPDCESFWVNIQSIWVWNYWVLRCASASTGCWICMYLPSKVMNWLTNPVPISWFLMAIHRTSLDISKRTVAPSWNHKA